MTYRDIFKTLEHFGLLDLEANQFWGDSDPDHDDAYFMVVYEDTDLITKDICIKVATGEIILTESEAESEDADYEETFRREMSLEDIKDWG